MEELILHPPVEPPLHMLLGKAGHLCYLYENDLLEPHGVTAKQAKLLIFLIMHQDREINQRVLEKQFSLKGATITSKLANLEENGFIERTVSPTDARNKIVVVTEKGKQLLPILLSCEKQVTETALTGFDNEDRRLLASLVERVVGNIQSKFGGKSDE